MRFIILSYLLCFSVYAEVNLRLNNETKEVLPELKVRARIFENRELLEVFYQGETVCSVTISEDRFYIESPPGSPLFVSAEWSKTEAEPILRITKHKTIDSNFEVNRKREKRLQWRVVSDPLRFVMTDKRTS